MPTFQQLNSYYVKLKNDRQIALVVDKDKRMAEHIKKKIEEFETVDWYHPDNVLFSWE